MSNSTIQNIGLLFLRVSLSVMMLTHGIPKLSKLISGDFEFASVFGLGAPISLVLAVLGEVVFPILIIIGFKTRLSAIPVVCTMAVAAFIYHANDPYGVKEKALLFLIGFISIALLGPGRYSADKK